MAEEESHLWTHQDGVVVLNTRLVDPKSFIIQEMEDYIFIHPKHTKWDWNQEELRLRSVAVDRQGHVVSSGFPKFFNAGERPADDTKLETALSNGEEVFFTEKLDGTLMIRSVLPDGRVTFRTRGTWNGGDFAPVAFGLSVKRYPVLLEPTFMPAWSLLFEYVGPENLIVIAYSEPELHFLGAIRHDDLHLMPVEQIQEFASEHGLRAAPLVELPRDLKGLQQTVREWDDREGVVARLHRGQLLIKVKSARYLALHAMRANLSYDLIAEYACGADVRSEEDLEAGLRELGYDYELLQTAKSLFRTYLEQVTRSEDALATAQWLHAEFLAQVDDPTNPPADERERRKRFAMQATRQPAPLPTILFSLYDGRLERAQALLFRWYVVERRP
ncbi:MAG TPA: RNA ligase [Ktedonobacterales bacterium]